MNEPLNEDKMELDKTQNEENSESRRPAICKKRRTRLTGTAERY